ncbi:YdcF family protein [Consotaella aegiceratis]|uniref:YdcF family protein n=1 Tax=Consotaella aegiceratis TaxID=3097961 RepID=UPI002F415A26
MTIATSRLSADKECAEDLPDGAKRRPSSFWRWLRRGTLAVFILLLLAGGYVVGGFLRFMEDVSNLSIPADTGPADGIVVLTGGAMRLESAIDLLKNGKARRLLISGVNRGTSARALSRLTATDPSWFECCIDIDRAALNTIGNAEMAAAWAHQRGLQSLILVTSDYHMPRSLLEFDRTPLMPAIQPYPVAREDFWTKDRVPTSIGLRVLAMEYLKFLAAKARSFTGYQPTRPVDERIAGLGQG